MNAVLKNIFLHSIRNINKAHFRKMSEEAISKKSYNGKIKKRKWEDRIASDADTDAKKVRSSEERVKRKKYVILLGYSGVNYYGMQRNPGVKTIEEDLLIALLKVKLINEDAFKQIQNVQFQRAARTDKGVSAARQVVSIKIPEHATPETINAHLPETIKVFTLKRVTKGFNSKSQCDARTYTYLIPTYAFTHKSETVSESTIYSYRVTEETLDKVNETLKLFVGTKNFHNFTSKKLFLDSSSKRYMISLECEKPFIANDMEFAIIKIKGQSFMLHQIRKMIGLTLAVVKELTTVDTIERAWTPTRLDLPMAPGLGLVLDQVHYDRYNKRYGEDGMHEVLDWLDVEKEVQEFKEKYIYPNIIKTEIEEKSMLLWIETLSLHSYDERSNVEQDETGDSEMSSGSEELAKVSV